MGARTAVVIDDDPAVRLMLRVALEASAFVVHEAEDGPAGVRLTDEVRPELVTLDLVMPGFDGIEACRRIRVISDAYIIMISARADEADCLVGLASGADDYVVKPFSPREVQARVAAMFRRPRSILTGQDPGRARPGELIAPALPAPPNLGFGPVGFEPGSGSIPAPRPGEPAARAAVESGVLRHGRLILELEARAAWLGRTELALTKIEFDLLATMMGSPRRVWRREMLLNIVWGGLLSDQHVVEVHLGNLRRKLAEATPGGAQLIKTVRGIGYRLLSPEPSYDRG
jgi:two-component system OmpR family response regulator